MSNEKQAVPDFSPMRIAMEHMVNYQGMSLDMATLFFVMYSAGLVKDHDGIERMRSVIFQAIEELDPETIAALHRKH